MTRCASDQPPMLFDLWLQTAAAASDRDALVDAITEDRVSFGELARKLEAAPRCERGEIIHAPAAAGVESFLIQTLRAWRDGGVLVPCESARVDEMRLRGLPPGVAHVKSTSGSTGGARLVLFNEEQLLADMRHITTTMGFDAACPNLGVISPAHSYGFSHLVLPLLLTGMTLWHVSDPLPSSMRAAFARGADFFLPAVPAMWRAWHLSGLLRGAPVRLAMSAGAPLSLELEREVFAEAALKIHNFYGASECGGIAYDASLTPREDAALVGAALNGVTLRVNDEGCMIVESAAVGMRCWPPDPAHDAMVRDGVFTTTDLAEISTDGARLLGRATETIHVAGRKVAPAEIESALLACERVRHCVVFGVPSADSTRVEDIVACVHAVDEVCSGDDLAALIAGRMPAWQMPRQWWITSSLVPDERGKISRARWREMFLRNGRSNDLAAP